MTAPAIILPVLLDCDNGDGVLVGWVLGIFNIVVDGGGGGSKDIVQVYSSLLLISSNSMSFSVSCVYPTPITCISSELNNHKKFQLISIYITKSYNHIFSN